MKKQIQSYYSKLTHLIRGGIWIRTHKVRLQSPGTSLHHQDRRCVKGITEHYRSTEEEASTLDCRSGSCRMEGVWVKVGSEGQKQEVGYPRPQDTPSGTECWGPTAAGFTKVTANWVVGDGLVGLIFTVLAIDYRLTIVIQVTSNINSSLGDNAMSTHTVSLLLF